MGKRYISEKRVLKKLGIKDFRHITKEKIMNFASMLPYMDPEVAKKALEQFPSFKDLAGDMVSHYKEIVIRVFEENRESQKSFYDVCMSIIHSLQKELDDENIDSHERDRIEDKMIRVAIMIGEKDRENKKWLLKVFGGVGVFILGLAGAAAAVLGAITQASDSDGYMADADNDDGYDA